MNKTVTINISGIIFHIEEDAYEILSKYILEIKNYFKDAFDDNIFLRQGDFEYFIMMTNHFLAVMLENKNVPDLHLLEIQEELGVKFTPEKIDHFI